MRYLSVCSGIEAATVAWHPLGWTPVAFSEIEKFPSQVLEHHYPDVPNVGDMTKFKEWDLGAINLLVGGTPCQSFSVAGLRKGLDDPRGNLMLTYLAIAQRFKPKWVVWENVPGVLSSNGGKDFGSLLGGLAELGYGFAYRVLDAQYFGVAQRRRRVFVVGCLGDWRAAAAVLFERDSLQGNPAPKREARESIAGTITTSTGKCDQAGSVASGLIPEISRCLVAGGQQRNDAETETLIPTFGGVFSYGIQATIIGRDDKNGGNDFGVCEGIAPTLTKADQHGVAVIHGTQDPCVSDVAFALGRNSGQENAIAFVQNSRDEVRLMGGDGQVVGALMADTGAKQQCYIGQTSAFSNLAPTLKRDYGKGYGDGEMDAGGLVASFKGGQGASAGGIGYSEHVSPTLSSADSGSNRTPSLLQNSQVRRLTPRECERLQGFPDDYTLIPVGKKMAADGPRYKALGNSMAVPVMHWIGSRIEQVEAILSSKVAA